MKLLVPSNWDNRLLLELVKRKVKVHEIYGSLANGLIGSGRSRQSLTQVEIPQAKEHIALAHKLGIRFNYALNASCLGNMEQSISGKRQIREHLDLIARELKVDAITATQPWLIELIRREYPGIEIVASVIIHIESVQMARFYESLGVDRINLSVMVNRKFRLIESIIKSVTCDTELLANEVCLLRCPFRLYHYNMMGHTSQQEGRFVQYCLINCTRRKLENNAAEVIKAAWVRPEDIEVYEALDISFIKLESRVEPTDWLIRCAQAYYERNYEGNLADIIATHFYPTDRLDPGAQGRKLPPSFYIANSKLDGFINHFKQMGDKCDQLCHSCTYCPDIARQVITMDNSAAEAYVKELELLNSRYLSSFSEV